MGSTSPMGCAPCDHDMACIRSQVHTMHLAFDWTQYPTVRIHQWASGEPCDLTTGMGCTLGPNAG